MEVFIHECTEWDKRGKAHTTYKYSIDGVESAKSWPTRSAAVYFCDKAKAEKAAK